MISILKERRKELGLTVAELGKRVGVSPSTITRWENGTMDIKRDKIGKLAEALLISPVDIIKPECMATTGIPILGKVAAGAPIIASEYIEGYIDAPPAWSDGQHFALRIQGESMEPMLHNGDLVVVRRQAAAMPGAIVVAMVDSEDAVCKELRLDGGRVVLHSLNPAYMDIPVGSDADFRIIGQVIESRHTF